MQQNTYKRLVEFSLHYVQYAWNVLPDFKKTTLSLSILLDNSLNISTFHFTSTLSAFEVILQLTRYINYLRTYSPTVAEENFEICGRGFDYLHFFDTVH